MNGARPNSASADLAEAMAAFDCDRLGAETVSAAKWAYLDWLGSAIAGGRTPPGVIVTEFAKSFQGPPQAMRISDGVMDSVPNAALVNGVCSHVLELDDVHRGGIIHAAAPVIPAALATAEAQGRSGKALIGSIVAGYEACIRIAEAVTPSHYKLWHTTGTCGTFGAAVAAGKLLDLDAAQMLSALGSAGTQAAGLWQFNADGAMSKHLHPGKAAMNGVISAYLAQKGFTAARAILEGPQGFFAATSAEVDYAKLLSGLNGPGNEKILENSYKLHSSCRHTHAAIDAALALRDELRGDFRAIEKLRAGTYGVALDVTDNPNPETVYQAKFSLQFCIALALVRGAAGLGEFTEETLWDGELRTMMELIGVTVDPELDRLHPKKWPVRIEAELRDGTLKSFSTMYPKGDPENPFTEEEFERKFVGLVEPILGERETECLIVAVSKLETANRVETVLPGCG